MALKKTSRSKERGRPRGPGSRRDRAGTPGEDREIVLQLGNVLARVTQELEAVQRTLRVQFTRIAELQGELDDLRLALGKHLT